MLRWRTALFLLPTASGRVSAIFTMVTNRGKRQQQQQQQQKTDRSGNSSSMNRGYQSSSSFRPPKDRIECLGRAMTKILRHMAVDMGLHLRSDGFCSVDELLRLNMTTMAGVPLATHTKEEVLKAVELDSKQRFSTLLEDGKLYIRANQGHSIQQVRTEELLKEIKTADEVPLCVHGTFKSNLDSILKQGLKRMTRNHIHFATGLPKDDGVISGMKNFCDVLIYLDLAKALQDGMKVYMSDNKVVLSEGFDGVIPVKYFERVVDRRSKRVLWPVAAASSSQGPR